MNGQLGAFEHVSVGVSRDDGWPVFRLSNMPSIDPATVEIVRRVIEDALNDAGRLRRLRVALYQIDRAVTACDDVAEGFDAVQDVLSELCPRCQYPFRTVSGNQTVRGYPEDASATFCPKCGADGDRPRAELLPPPVEDVESPLPTVNP